MFEDERKAVRDGKNGESIALLLAWQEKGDGFPPCENSPAIRKKSFERNMAEGEGFFPAKKAEGLLA